MLAGVNLRVATLKKANLKNCDLRGAVLAGADLEVRSYIDISLHFPFGYRYYHFSPSLCVLFSYE